MAGENLLKMAEQKIQSAAEKVAKDMIATCFKEQQTNADRIRAMSDEELAVFLADEVPHGDCYGCVLECLRVKRDGFDNVCQSAWYNWLKQPAEGE